MSLPLSAQLILQAATKLPRLECAKLADKLSTTLDPLADEEWRAAWEPEIARRLAEIENGTAKLRDWEEVRRELQESIDAASASQTPCTDERDWDVLDVVAQQLFDAALTLTDSERSKLANALYESLEPPVDEGSAASLEKTIARRVAEVENGTAKLHTRAELQQMMDDALNAGRKAQG